MENVRFDSKSFELYLERTPGTKTPALKKLTKSQKTIIKNQLEINKQHFDTHGWDLDFRMIADDIVCDLLGFHVVDVLAQYFVNNIKNTMVTYGNREIKIGLNKGFIIYNSQIDKIFLQPDKKLDDNEILLGEL